MFRVPVLAAAAAGWLPEPSPATQPVRARAAEAATAVRTARRDVVRVKAMGFPLRAVRTMRRGEARVVRVREWDRRVRCGPGPLRVQAGSGAERGCGLLVAVDAEAGQERGPHSGQLSRGAVPGPFAGHAHG